MNNATREMVIPVCWRVKTPGLEWLRKQAAQQDRSVTWIVNKLIEQAKEKSEAQHAKQA